MTAPRARVFLVHGRDHGARDALSQLITAFGAEVVSWDEARALHGAPTPTTLDIIDAAIDQVEAIVVLFTPDEAVRLTVPGNSSEQESEFRRQARPNVIFEAGWSLARRKQKTVLVAMGASDLLSDIDGLNYVRITDDVESRRDLRQRLIDSGCTLPADATDWRDPRRSVSLAPVLERVSSHNTLPDALPPDQDGKQRFVPYLVDATLSLTLDETRLRDEVRSSLQNARKLDLKYHYLGSRMARYWTEVCEEATYGHRELVKSEESAMKTILELEGLADHDLGIVSLGPGDGALDVRLLTKLQDLGVRFRGYFPIDISQDLLRITTTRLQERFRSRELDEFPIKAIQADFEDSLAALDSAINPWQELRKPGERNLFFLNGFTFGNSDEGKLLTSVASALYQDDLLFVDCRLHQLGAREPGKPLESRERDALAQSYNSAAVARFTFGPVEEALDFAIRYSDLVNAERKQRAIPQMVHKLKRDEVQIVAEVHTSGASSVPSSVNVEFVCHGLLNNGRVQAALGGPGVLPPQVRHRPVSLASTTYYDFESLEKWFAEIGFVVRWSNRVNGFGMFLLAPI